MKPLKASMQTSAASKIKQKLLNTSSFFKVSLKTNNKALAVALASQRQRSTELEKDIVYLQKQVEVLCFELAARKHKERRLLHILRSWYGSTLQHFDVVAELFSDSDLCQPSENSKSIFGGSNEENPVPKRLSRIFPLPEFDMQPAPNPHISQTPAVDSTCRQAASCGSVVETEPEQGHKPENTVLVNSTMEMTLSSPTQIVTVETKAKKHLRSENKEETSSSAVKTFTESRTNEVVRDSIETALTIDGDVLQDITRTGVLKPQSPKIMSKSVKKSHIPKLSKSKTGTDQKTLKNKLKSCDSTKSKTDSLDTILPNLDDYFTDPDVILSAEKDNGNQTMSKITCRRSRTNGRRMSSVSRRTFISLPSRESESCQSKLEVPQENSAAKEGTRTHQDQQLEDFCCGTGELTHVEHGGSIVAKPGGRINSRDTFVISVGRSSNCVSPGISAVEQDFIPAPEFGCKAKEPSTVTDANVAQHRSESNPQRHREETVRSRKRSWVATEDSLEDTCNSASHGETHCSSNTKFQKSKKAKRDGSRRSNRVKAAHIEEACGDLLDDRKKKKQNKSCRSRADFHSVQNEEGFPDIGPERNKDHPEDLQTVNSAPDMLEALYDSNTTKSKSRMDSASKQSGEKQHMSTDTKHRRGTFVVCRRTNSARTLPVPDPPRDEAAHQNLGELLMDEMPPWLTKDFSSADAEGDSVLASPAATVAEEAAAPVATGSVLTSVTNTISTVESENGARTRRRNSMVSYKEPPLNSKIRRGDKYTDSMFLSSPVFKEDKKKKKKRRQQ